MNAFRSISYSGTGTPNGFIVGSPGDFYTNTTGGVGATLWVKETGTGTNTGWSLVSGGSSTPGAVQAIIFTVGLVTVNSATLMPAGSTVIRATLNVTIAYTPGALITLGTLGNPVAYQGPGDNDPQVVDLYDAPQITALIGAPSPVQATVTGAANGAATVLVEYTVPNP